MSDPEKLNFRCRRGLTLVEVLAVVFMISLLSVIAAVNLTGAFRGNTFRGQVHEFRSAFEKAAAIAREKGKRFEIVIDLNNQTWLLREIRVSGLVDVKNIPEEEIISIRDLSLSCQVLYVYYDDGDQADSGYAKFRVGPAGWRTGGKIVMIDDDGREYSLVIDRLSQSVDFVKGDALILEPRYPEEMGF